jgi:hypothetical protein
LQTHAEAGDHSALGWAAWLLERADRVDEAVGLYRRAAETGDRDALGHAARLLEKTDRVTKPSRSIFMRPRPAILSHRGMRQGCWRRPVGSTKRLSFVRTGSNPVVGLVLAAQNAVDYRYLGVVTSGSALFRQIGGSVGVSVFGAIFANQLARNLAGKLPAGVPTPTAAEPGRGQAAPTGHP